MEFKHMGDKIRRCLEEFVRELGYGQQLKVSEPYLIYERINDTSQYPNSDSPGVYLFCSPQNFLYIGKSSRYLGNRVWSHIGRKKRANEEEEYPNAEHWIKESKPHVALFTVPFEEKHWWLAAALEGYLTDQLNPSHAAEGRRS